MSELSEDIRTVYQSFGRKDLSYKEVTERKEYHSVLDKWPLLRLLHGQKPAEEADQAQESFS